MSSLSFYKQLDAIVATDQQPTIYDLYLSQSCDDIRSRLVMDSKLTSHKSIIVYGLKQYLGNEHSDLVLGQILEAKPSAYMQVIESLCLNRCGFISHELFTDGHVCKFPDRHSFLDCAHSTSRKMLESAMALIANETSKEGASGTSAQREENIDEEFATFSEDDHGIVWLDRAIGEVARGPIRHDTISTLSAEIPAAQINERTSYDDLMTMLPVLRPELKNKQAEYGESLLRLAKRAAPKLFQVLRQRLIVWQELAKN